MNKKSLIKYGVAALVLAAAAIALVTVVSIKPMEKEEEGMGLTVEKPEGAFYMFIDLRKFGMDSDTFCARMLKEGLVGIIPGIHFGTEGFARLSYCYSDADLKEGLDRMERFLRTLA